MFSIICLPCPQVRIGNADSWDLVIVMGWRQLSVQMTKVFFKQQLSGRILSAEPCDGEWIQYCVSVPQGQEGYVISVSMARMYMA